MKWFSSKKKKIVLSVLNCRYMTLIKINALKLLSYPLI